MPPGEFATVYKSANVTCNSDCLPRRRGGFSQIAKVSIHLCNTNLVQNISFMDLVFHKKNIKLEIPKNTIIKKNRVKIPSNHLITSGDE